MGVTTSSKYNSFLVSFPGKYHALIQLIFGMCAPSLKYMGHPYPNHVLKPTYFFLVIQLSFNVHCVQQTYGHAPFNIPPINLTPPPNSKRGFYVPASNECPKGWPLKEGVSRGRNMISKKGSADGFSHFVKFGSYSKGDFQNFHHFCLCIF